MFICGMEDRALPPRAFNDDLEGARGGARSLLRGRDPRSCGSWWPRRSCAEQRRLHGVDAYWAPSPSSGNTHGTGGGDPSAGAGEPRLRGFCPRRGGPSWVSAWASGVRHPTFGGVRCTRFLRAMKATRGSRGELQIGRFQVAGGGITRTSRRFERRRSPHMSSDDRQGTRGREDRRYTAEFSDGFR